jgi:surfactin synthase thioesterase subunit
MASPDDHESRWIRRFHPAPGARVRLVCFPHAGGSASYYFPMSCLAPPWIEVWAVQYPGRQDRRHEPLVPDIADLSEAMCAVFADALDGPFAFFGHSMGATLAFEVAVRLQRRGIRPLWFFASGRRAPSRRRSGAIHLLDDAGLLAELRQAGGTDQRVLDDEELLATILPVVRNDYRAIENYAWLPGPALDCPTTVLVGESDPQTTLDEAEAWADHVTGPCDVQVFPGGHFYLEEKSGVLETITGKLGAAEPVEGSRS